jgi:hypothetical protein
MDTEELSRWTSGYAPIRAGEAVLAPEPPPAVFG